METMLLSKTAQRALLADKLADAANLAVGALFFGQFFSGRPFSLTLALCGLGSWVGLFAWAVVLAARRKD
jgi:hypothetical protein